MGTREDSDDDTLAWGALRSIINGEAATEVPQEALIRVARQGEVAALIAELCPHLAKEFAATIEREVFVSLQLDRALNEAAKALKSAQVPNPVIVKGCAAARLVYENPSHRIGVDVDVLVAEEDFDKTLDILRSAGFHSSTSESLLLRHGPRPWEEELAWVTEGGSVSLDVHRKLAASDRFQIDHSGVIRRAIDHDEVPWPISHPEDTLLHTALHMASNRFYVPLKSWVDVKGLLDHPEVSLESVFERAKRWKMRTSLWAVLWVCQRWFPGSVDESSLSEIAPPIGVRHLLQAGLSADGHRPIKGNPRRLWSQLCYGPLLSDDLASAGRWLRESARQVKRVASAQKPG